jgi:hypothetical protein
LWKITVFTSFARYVDNSLVMYRVHSTTKTENSFTLVTDYHG